MNDESFAPEAILAALNAHGAACVVVGGFAVAAHGVVRATRDLDLVVDRTWENAGRLAAALDSLEAVDLEGTRDAVSQETLARNANRRLQTRHGEVHLLAEIDGVPSYADLQPALVIDLAGERVAIARLEDLRAMKRVADRQKNRVDLAELEALGAE